jgi:hypothetical protein
MALTVGYLRFSRRRRIAPGIRLNLSKSGPSISFGGPGLHYTVGHHRRRVSVGMPGTGLSYVAYSRSGGPRHGSPGTAARVTRATAPTGTHPASRVHRWAAALATVLVVAGVIALLTTPAGIAMLAAGLVIAAVALVHRARSPDHAVAALLDRAHAHPERRAALVEAASARYQAVPAAVVALASLRADQQNYPESRDLYRRYLSLVPGDPLARLHLGQVDLLLGDNAGAIADLLDLVQRLDVGEPLHLAALAALATAYLNDGQAATALQLLQTAPLRRRQLSAELQQCLLARAAAHYALGHHAAAGNDADRLFALTLAPPIHEMAQAMRDGSFTLATGPPPPPPPAP